MPGSKPAVGYLYDEAVDGTADVPKLPIVVRILLFELESDGRFTICEHSSGSRSAVGSRSCAFIHNPKIA